MIKPPRPRTAKRVVCVQVTVASERLLWPGMVGIKAVNPLNMALIATPTKISR